MDESLFEADFEKELGNLAYKNHQLNKALEHYKKAALLNPQNMIYRNNMAAVYFEKREFSKCIGECESALEIGSKSSNNSNHKAKALARIAHAHQMLNNYEVSLNFYKRSLTEAFSSDVMKRTKELELIIKAKKQIDCIDPHLSQVHKHKGNELFKKGNFPGALACYTEAIKNNPIDPILYCNRSACYIKLLEFRFGVKDCQQAIDIEPTYTKAYIRKGSCLLTLREYKKAGETFLKALELDLNSEEALEGFKNCLKQEQTLISSNNHITSSASLNEEEMDLEHILSDPNCVKLLQEIKQDPNQINKYLSDPENSEKITTFFQLGLL